MDAATESYNQSVLDERRNSLEALGENSWGQIRYPDLCHKQRLLIGSSKVDNTYQHEEDDPPNGESVQPGGDNAQNAIDPKTLCMKLGGVYSSLDPRFYLSELEGELVPVWVDSSVPVDWCRCEVKGLLEFTLRLHQTLEKAKIWPEYRLKTLKEMDGMVISTKGPLGPEAVYPTLLTEEPVADEAEESLFRLLIDDKALSDTVATHPPTPAIMSGPSTPEDVSKLDSDDETGEDKSSVEPHQSSIEPPADQTALYDLDEQVIRTQDVTSEGETENEVDRKDPITPVLSEPDQQAVGRTSVVADIPIEMPTLTSEEIAQALETGNWMDALGRFPKAQRPLTIVGQVAVKEYLDAHESIRLKPGKIDQDLKRIAKQEKEAAEGTKNPPTTITDTTTTASTSEKNPKSTVRKKRNRTVAPPDLTLRTSKGVIVPETITICRAQVNMVGGRWLVSRDGSCSMAIRASQEYRRHFVERHLGGRRPTKEESLDVTPDRPLDAKDHDQSAGESEASESTTPKDEPTAELLESSASIINDRIGKKGKGKRKYDEPDGSYEGTKRAKIARNRQVKKDMSSTEGVARSRNPGGEGSSTNTAIGDTNAEPGIGSASKSK